MSENSSAQGVPLNEEVSVFSLSQLVFVIGSFILCCIYVPDCGYTALVFMGICFTACCLDVMSHYALQKNMQFVYLLYILFCNQMPIYEWCLGFLAYIPFLVYEQMAQNTVSWLRPSLKIQYMFNTLLLYAYYYFFLAKPFQHCVFRGSEKDKILDFLETLTLFLNNHYNMIDLNKIWSCGKSASLNFSVFFLINYFFVALEEHKNGFEYNRAGIKWHFLSMGALSFVLYLKLYWFVVFVQVPFLSMGTCLMYSASVGCVLFTLYFLRVKVVKIWYVRDVNRRSNNILIARMILLFTLTVILPCHSLKSLELRHGGPILDFCALFVPTPKDEKTQANVPFRASASVREDKWVKQQLATPIVVGTEPVKGDLKRPSAASQAMANRRAFKIVNSFQQVLTTHKVKTVHTIQKMNNTIAFLEAKTSEAQKAVSLCNEKLNSALGLMYKMNTTLQSKSECPKCERAVVKPTPLCQKIECPACKECNATPCAVCKECNATSCPVCKQCNATPCPVCKQYNATPCPACEYEDEEETIPSPAMNKSFVEQCMYDFLHRQIVPPFWCSMALHKKALDLSMAWHVSLLYNSTNAVGNALYDGQEYVSKGCNKWYHYLFPLQPVPVSNTTMSPKNHFYLFEWSDLTSYVKVDINTLILLYIATKIAPSTGRIARSNSRAIVAGAGLSHLNTVYSVMTRAIGGFLTGFPFNIN